MFMIVSILAWLRAIAFLSVLCLQCTFTYAQPHDERLFASSITYCDPPEAILVDQLDVTYFNANQSIFFNITAASVSPNLNVSANVLVNVYGMTPVNLTLDLCEILGGALCPLPEYTFLGTDTLTLPSSLGIADYIPSIAFAIPDLEGFAQIKLTEVETGDVKACIQVTLSNGWSAQQTAVSWTTAAIAIVVLLISLWVSVNSPNSTIPYRFLDMMSLFQTIAFSAFLDLNYPSLYRAFTLNFSWAVGLFTTHDSEMQQSINNMRALTGGSMTNRTDAAIAYVNRKLSPYNFDATKESPSSFSLFKRGSEMLARRGVDTVTDVSPNVLNAGVPLYANSLHIVTANAFMTVFLHTLCLIAMFGGLLAILFLVARGIRKFVPKHAETCDDLLDGFASYARAWSLRVFLVLAFPLLVFSVFQWTLDDSWLSILLAVIVFVAVFATIIGVSFVLLREARRANALVLYSDSPEMLPYSPLIGQYHARRFYLFFPVLILPIFKAIIIAAGKNNGLAQLVVLMIIELSTVLIPIVLRPYKTRGGDVFSTYLAIVRLVCTGLMIAFVERLDVGAILRVVIGCVVGIVFCANIIALVINILIHVYHHVRPQKQEDADKSITECGTEPASWEKRSNSTFFGESEQQFTHVRPRNPTPDCNAPLDPAIRESYPVNTPPSTTNDHFTSRGDIRDSVSTSLGSILPRRFDITPLSSPESFEFEPTVTGSSHSSSTTLGSISLADSSKVGHCNYNPRDRSFRS